jgi:ATP-binding cassette subfamily C protein
METFLLIPIISISGIVNGNTGANPISGIVKFMQKFPNLFELPIILCIYILLVVGQSLLQRNITIRNVKIHQGFVLNLRLEIYHAVLQANWDFFIKKRKSDIINSLTTELGRVSAGLALLLQLLTTFIFTLIQIGLALWLSVKLTIFILICGCVHVLLTRKFAKRAKILGSLTSEISQSYLAGITDQLNGIKDIKSNTLEESRLLWLRSMTREMEHEQKEYLQLRTSSELLSKISSALFVSIFIFLSAKIFHAQPAQLLLIVIIFFRLWPRIASIQSGIEQIAAYIPAFKVLIELEKDCKQARELKGGQHYNTVESIRIEQQLECNNVFYRYNPQESIFALQDISLKVPVNHMTAIVGPSGAGKSTLIDILMGLMQPERGQILIDGTPLTSSNIFALRRSISYVPQDPFLFNASIRENLLLIKPAANEEEIWEALEFSASADFVKRLPQRLDTLIGDRGVRLSGGERQRLVLARAILRKPAILILDEATSALDTENETKIQEVLDRLKGTMTIVVIAHRLSTIRNADQVIVLDRGKVIQKGGFSQLAHEKRGLFSKLLVNQMDLACSRDKKSI